MAKTKLDLTEMFGTFKVEKSENSINEKVSGAPSAQPPTGILQKEKSKACDEEQKNLQNSMIALTSNRKTVEDVMSNSSVAKTQKADTKKVKAKPLLVRVDFKVNEDIKNKFQKLCGSYGYTMTEILKEFILQSVKKGRL